MSLLAALFDFFTIKSIEKYNIIIPKIRINKAEF